MNAHAGAIEAIAAAASPAGDMELLGGDALPRPDLDRVAIRGWSFGGS